MLINDRFVVDLLRNEVTGRQTGKVNHVEPRLMKLLCLLAENGGKTVSRKMIVKEIWNDYPGGDEGLNQAISVLRKLLNDNKKRIIETLPKTGYCFHGAVAPDKIVVKRESVRIVYVAAAACLLLIIALMWGYYNYQAHDKIVLAKAHHAESVKALRMDSIGKLDSKDGAKAHKLDSGRKLDSKQSVKAYKADAAGKLDSKEAAKAYKMDSAGKLDSKKH